MSENSLIDETSPYLLQHAQNPVNWYSWNETALKKACYIEPKHKKRVLIEEKIEGMEFTCIVLIDYVTGKYLPFDQ